MLNVSSQIRHTLDDTLIQTSLHTRRLNWWQVTSCLTVWNSTKARNKHWQMLRLATKNGQRTWLEVEICFIELQLHTLPRVDHNKNVYVPFSLLLKWWWVAHIATMCVNSSGYIRVMSLSDWMNCTNNCVTSVHSITGWQSNVTLMLCWTTTFWNPIFFFVVITICPSSPAAPPWSCSPGAQA